MRFVIDGKIKPYVRMTQRGKWVKPDAQEYLASKIFLGHIYKQAMRQQGWAMFPAQTPLAVDLEIYMDSALHRSDLDNQVKAALDAAQGIVFRNDAWIDQITARRILSEKSKIVVVFTEQYHASNPGQSN